VIAKGRTRTTGFHILSSRCQAMNEGRIGRKENKSRAIQLGGGTKSGTERTTCFLSTFRFLSFVVNCLFANTVRQFENPLSLFPLDHLIAIDQTHNTFGRQASRAEQKKIQE